MDCLRDSLLEASTREEYKSLLEKVPDPVLKKVIGGSTTYSDYCRALKKEFFKYCDWSYAPKKMSTDDIKDITRYDNAFTQYADSIGPFVSGSFKPELLSFDYNLFLINEHKRFMKGMHGLGALGSTAATTAGFVFGGPAGAVVTGTIMYAIGSIIYFSDHEDRSALIATLQEFYSQLEKLSVNLDQFITSVYSDNKLVEFGSVDSNLDINLRTAPILNSPDLQDVYFKYYLDQKKERGGMHFYSFLESSGKASNSNQRASKLEDRQKKKIVQYFKDKRRQKKEKKRRKKIRNFFG